MNIVKFPTLYASAFQEAICRISATADEVVEVDLYDHSQTTIIGKRRFSGTTSYDVNLANCAQSQLDILPLTTVQCAFVEPVGRTVNVTVGIGGVKKNTILTGGCRTCYSYEKLSRSPKLIDISTNQNDEIAVIVDGGTLRAEAVFDDPAEMTVELATKSDAQGLYVFTLKMSDLMTKLHNAGKDKLNLGEQMAVRIVDGEGYVLAEQRYRAVPDLMDDVRVCWWNSLGQIDYCTMRRVLDAQYDLTKERILTPDGYKTTSCKRERKMRIVSDFVYSEMIEWLSEIASAPRVWIVENGNFVRVDVIDESVKLSGVDPVQMDLTIRYNEPDILQHE